MGNEHSFARVWGGFKLAFVTFAVALLFYFLPKFNASFVGSANLCFGGGGIIQQLARPDSHQNLATRKDNANHADDLCASEMIIKMLGNA